MKSALRFFPVWWMVCLFAFAGLLSIRADYWTAPFTNTTLNSSNTNSGSIGWSTYFASSTQSSTLTNLTSLTTFNGDYACITPANSYPDTQNYGFLALVTNTISTGVFASYTTFSDNTLAEGTSISWVMGNNQTSAKVRIMVQSGGSWYVSALTFSNISTNTVSSAATFQNANSTNIYSLNFSTTASNWLALDLNTTTGTMNLGTTASADLSSTITGVGFYLVDTQTTVARFDNLTIIPEPTSAALFVLSVAVLLLGHPLRKSGIAPARQIPADCHAPRV